MDRKASEAFSALKSRLLAFRTASPIPVPRQVVIDVADTIQRQAKELKAVRDQNEVLRDHLALANGEVERLQTLADIRGSRITRLLEEDA